MRTVAPLVLLACVAVVSVASADVPAATTEVADDGHGTPREVVPVPAVPDSMAVPAPTVGDEIHQPPPEMPPEAAKAAPDTTPTIPESERHDSAKDQ